MTLEDWLAIGVRAGWISAPVCDRHEGVPLTEAELRAVDLGEDPCIPAVRLWTTDQDATTGVILVHAPSRN